MHAVKRFFVKFTAYLLALCLPFAAFIAYVQTRPAMFEGSMMGASHIKLDKLCATEGARVIIVGGSSAPYSVVCADVQAALGMPCVNMGCTAYLGLAYYLAQLRGNLHEGDIVILAPEYVMYENGYSNSIVWMAAENHANVLKKLPAEYLPGMMRGFWAYAKQKLTLLRTDGAPTRTAAQAYADAGFGEWGDITKPRVNILEHKYNTQDCRTVSADTLAPAVARDIRRFAAYARAQGASVYLTYAPFDALALQGGTAGVDALQARLQAECPDVPWLGRLADGVLDADYFYDTNNHLNSAGAALRTQRLIADLEEALA